MLNEIILAEIISGVYEGNGWHSQPDNCGDAPEGMAVGAIQTTEDGRIFVRLGEADEEAACGRECCGIVWYCHREVFIS